MGADNWANCPICKQNTFREDFEIGVEEDGVVRVEYKGVCTNQDCKARCEFKDGRKVTVP